MDNKHLINKLQRLHEELKSLIDQFPISQREEIIFDKWSLKDILAHLIAWNTIDISHVQDLQNGKLFTWIEDWEKFNEEEVEKRRTQSWDKIYQEFVRSGDDVIKAYSLLSDDLWNKRFGPNNEITATMDLKGMINHYENEHIPQIKKYLMEHPSVLPNS